MIRRFVNLVAENHKTGLYSLHRVDVSKHLFHRTRFHAQEVPLLGQGQANTAAANDEPAMQMSQELPSHTAVWGSRSKLKFFGLVSPGISEGRILRISDAGVAMLYDADANISGVMPRLNGFKGPAPVSFSATRVGAKEEDMYIMHETGDGLDFNSCFHVLRFGSLHGGSLIETWYWESLPPPPLVSDPHFKLPLISSYTMVNGGSTICLSSAVEGIGGTYCFDTTSCKWRRAGDWVLPFDGKAEYVPDLKVWVGFSLQNPRHLCATTGLCGMLMDQEPPSPIVWQDHTPKELTAVSRVYLLDLGPGRFAVAKVFKPAVETRESGFLPDKDVGEGEFIILTGMEICCSGSDDNNPLKLKMFQHKSIRYIFANTTVHSVL